MVGRQIMRPAEADGLIAQLCVHLNRALRIGNIHGVAHQVTAGGEVWVIGCIADHGDIFVGRFLVESGRQQTIVLCISNSRGEAGGHVAFGVFENWLVDFDLIRIGDLAKVRLELGGVEIVDIALD